MIVPPDSKQPPSYESHVSDLNPLSTVKHTRLHAFSNGRKRLILMVDSRGPSEESLPIFFEGETITGSVELHLDKAERNLTHVELFINGHVGKIDPPLESKPIFEHAETLWDSSLGDPRETAAGQSSQSSKPHTLLGRYTWSFSFAIPRHFEASKIVRSRTSQTHKLPPSLSEGAGFVSYAIGTKIKRKTTLNPIQKWLFFFRYRLTNPHDIIIHRLSTFFVYAPRSEPASFSPLRQAAYRENTPLLGPENDPQGWKVFPSVVMSGRYDLHEFFDVNLRCTLALANPLSYTSGTVIPLAMMLESVDEKILGSSFISRPYFPKIKFYRKIRGEGSTEDYILATWSILEDPQHTPSPLKRMLYGEIKLPQDLTPSFDLGNVFVKYVVEMFTSTTRGYTTEKEGVRFRTNVQIVTDCAPGPRPRQYHNAT
ncbi:hypothetical protein BD410DRAFT_370315 [Rickenella mellea]|uniref:Arrestin-like N-terminal domain-containing protein n=1 Tax=Rickenella mellea TaxID=50990 RepID=A0A4Y7PZU3_9AGAM|nr:hypothetical protein BD410DRAFT_370315 [Rickenella mellea]